MTAQFRVPIVLVGNKGEYLRQAHPSRLSPCLIHRMLLHRSLLRSADLVTERQVPREIPVALAAHTWGGVPYFESSARNGINIDVIFEDVLRQVVRTKTAMEKEQAAIRKKKKFKCTIL